MKLMDKYMARLKHEDDTPDVEEVGTIRQYMDIFGVAAENIDTTYYPKVYGFLEWLRQNQPVLYHRIKGLEVRMSTPVQTGTTLNEFEELVQEWEAVHKQGIELYLRERG